MENKPKEMVTYAYFNFPSFIERLRTMRGDGEDVNINETIIILSTTVIESVIADMFIETLVNTEFSNELEKRAYNALLKRITRSTWNDYNDLSEIVLGKKLNHMIDNELWNCIKILFQLRNEIIHGNPAVGGNTHYSEDELNYPMKDSSNVSAYLLQKGIITKERPATINTKIADFFWESSKNFCLVLSKNGMNEKNEIVNLMLADIFKTD